MKTEFCFSRQGHDKGTLYYIIEETQNYVLVSDGRLHPLEKPKKKNLKHIQRTNFSASQETTVTNDNIKYLIKRFSNREI